MKKIIYMLFFFLLPAIAYGQELNQARQTLRAGDVLLKQQLYYPATVYSDTCRFWDFSKIKPYTDNYRVIIGNEGDSLITAQEHQAVYTYQISGDTLYLSGYRTATTRMDYNGKEVVLPFPFEEGSLYEGSFSGEGDYCGKMSLRTAGDIRIRGCARGTLVLPGEDTLRNVLCIESIKRFAEQVILAGTPETETNFDPNALLLQSRTDTTGMCVKTVRWYAAGSRYPVLETIVSTGWKDGEPYEHFRTAFLYHPENQYYDLAGDPENEHIRMVQEIHEQKTDSSELAGKSWTYKVGKSASTLFVDFEMGQSTTMRLSVFDIFGKTCIRKPEVRVPEGSSQTQIDLSALPVGEYLLVIQADGETAGEKFIK